MNGGPISVFYSRFRSHDTLTQHGKEIGFELGSKLMELSAGQEQSKAITII